MLRLTLSSLFAAALLSAQPGTVPGLGYLGIESCRAEESWSSWGHGILEADSERTIYVESNCDVNARGRAVVVVLTVLPEGPLGYVTLWSGFGRPFTSILNSFDGRNKTATAIVQLGAEGTLRIYSTHRIHFALDVVGLFGPYEGATYFPVTPCRLLDTRNSQGPLPPGSTRRFTPTGGACAVPQDAAGFSFNVTAIPSGPLRGLSVWPFGADRDRPILSSPTGTVVANATIIRRGWGLGDLALYASDRTDVVIDVTGYFGYAPGGLLYYPSKSCRLTDSREPPGAFSGPSFERGQTRSYLLPGSPCAPPASARAFVLNATVVPKEPLAYITLFPSGNNQPFVSSLNAFDAAVTSNFAIVTANSSAAVSAFSTHRTDLILDLYGYFAP